MIRQVCRRAHAEAYLTEEQFTEGRTWELADILNLKPAHYSKAPKQLNSAEVGKILASGTDISDAHYQLLLQYLRSTGQLWCDCNHMPHPAGALVLPPRAIQPPEFILDSYTFSCYYSHLGNSAIQFKRPADSVLFTGFVQVIWQIPLEGHMRTFLAARIPFTSLPYLNRSQRQNHHSYAQ
jgi:hypothetical protein